MYEIISLHPAVLAIYFIGIILLSVFTMNPYIIIPSLIFSCIYYIVLYGKKGIRQIFFISMPLFLFSVILRPLFYHNGVTPLIYINDMPVTLECIIHGFMMFFLLEAVLLWFMCFNRIFSSDKLMYLLKKVPHIALLVSMVLRLIPLMQNRYRQICEAEALMGTEKRTGMVNKCKGFLKRFSILISWSLEASIETSDSMEARGYGLKGRTSFHLFNFNFFDIICMIFTVISYIIFFPYIFTGKFYVSYFPKFIMEIKTSEIIPLMCIYLYLILPVICQLKGVVKWKKLNSKM